MNHKILQLKEQVNINYSSRTKVRVYKWVHCFILHGLYQNWGEKFWICILCSILYIF